jgi:hypothetical protein
MKREITGPTGRKFMWHKPPRAVMWRHGQAALVFRNSVSAMFERLAQQVGDAKDKDLELQRLIEQESVRLYAEMTDEEREKIQLYGDDVIANSVDLDEGESPNDLEEPDYWYIFNYSTLGHKQSQVQTKEGATDIETVETFSEQSIIPTNSQSGADVRQESVA